MSNKKICYIVLTCEAYINTRVKWQNETFFKNVNDTDIYFLSCKNHENKNIYGWNTADNYESCPTKYVQFLKNMTLQYDWYCFIDDDTFININNLHNLLESYDCNEKLYIGRLCMNYSPPFYMSGGAGFILSKSLYFSLITYIRDRDTNDNDLLQSIYGDLSVGLWIKNIDNVVMIDNTKLHSSLHKEEDNLQEFISFHFLKCFKDFEFYNNL
jgi:hypothetical protein